MRMQRQEGKHKELSFGGNVALVRHILAFSNDIHVGWLHEKMERVERDEGMHITMEEW